MVCLEAYRNRRKLCTAGAGQFGVLNASITWVAHHPDKLARRAKERRQKVKPVKLDLHVGGMRGGNGTPSEHLGRVDCDLSAGDDILVRVVELAAADEPRGIHRVDPVDDLKQKKIYVRQVAKELGWTIQTTAKAKPNKPIHATRKRTRA
jgi:hypothetical protein